MIDKKLLAVNLAIFQLLLITTDVRACFSNTSPPAPPPSALEVTVATSAPGKNGATPPPDQTYATDAIPDGSCGQSAYGSSSSAYISRLLGGSNAKPNEIPWQVRLSVKVTKTGTTFLCGGAIIAPQYVITAAHCILADSDVTVFAGTHSLAREYLDAVAVKASKASIHPNYDSKSGNFDIAVIQLSSSLTYSTRIQPICVPRTCQDDCTTGDSALISGWGTTSSGDTKPQAVLQKATVPLVARATCQSGFTNNDIQRTVTSQMVCAGVADGSVDTCKGDDGGPLSCKPSWSDSYYLTGVKSFVDKCGQAGVYSIYTRPCSVVTWIDSVTSGALTTSSYDFVTTPATTAPAINTRPTTRPRRRTTTTMAPETTPEPTPEPTAAPDTPPPPPPPPGPSPSPAAVGWTNDNACGISKYLDPGNLTAVGNSSVRIVGGVVSRNNEFPWQVRIITTTTQGSAYICGGSIITNQWIITAAHCIAEDAVKDGKSVVYLGSQKFSTTIPGEVVSSVVEQHYHPNYDDGTHDYDYALLKLNRTIAYSDYMRPICLLQPNCSGEAPTGKKCVISGWGTVVEGANQAAADLRKAQVPIVSRSACQQSFVNQGYFDTVTTRQVCAGVSAGGIDTCQGDSGGPLACQDDNGQFYLNGVTSFGYGCARPGLYGIYARPCTVMNWIMATTGVNTAKTVRNLRPG